MLEDIRRHHLASLRGRGSSGWTLYETAAGKVPKDLRRMFMGVLPRLRAERKEGTPVLTETETEALRRTLAFIDRYGVRALQDVTNAREVRPPKLETVNASKHPLLELKIRAAANNPRLLLCICGGIAIFLDAFKKKQQRLAKKDVDRAGTRHRDLQERGLCR